MRILLVQPHTYIPAHGGAPKSNRVLVEGLAARGHACRVVALATARSETRNTARLLDELAVREIQVTSFSSRGVVFRHNSVEVYAALDGAQLRAQMLHQIRDFQPTWTVVSSEDPTLILLSAALQAAPSRVVAVAHSPQPLPFGPASYTASPTGAEVFGRVTGIITVSNYMQDYLQRWGSLESVVLPFPVYGAGPFPHFGRFDEGYVTMINPCAIKGICIFLALARSLPEVQFAAVPTWGTTDVDRHALEQLPNIWILGRTDDIDEILAQTRILLVPSLWGEAFGYVAVEAMLRGIPVLASDVGGLPEAKLGVDYVLPARPITRYEARFDQQYIPIADVPEQDVQPWSAALRELLSTRARYEQLSMASREAALAFVSGIGIDPFEEYLQQLSQTTDVLDTRVSTAG